MSLKKIVLLGLLAALLIYSGQLAADDTTRLISDDVIYSSPITPEESLIDFAGARDQGIIDLPFATRPKLNRGCNDYKVNWDASTVVKYMVDVENLNPGTSYSRPTFYLKSENGWFSAAGKPVPLNVPNKCRFVFEPFRMRTEGKPTGLEKIDGVRIAIYRNKESDSKVRVLGIKAQKPSILFVVEPNDSPKGNPYTDSLVKILKHARIASTMVKYTDLTAETLKSAPVVMVPYQERMPKQTVDLLLDYAKNGGFLIGAYSLPGELMKGLGFAQGKYIRAKKIGDDFAQMRFNPELVKQFSGLLPDALTQASHNIISSRPLDIGQISDPFLVKEENRPRVVAWWYDANGNKTEHAAILQSGYGLFLSHVLFASMSKEKTDFFRTICLCRDESFRKELLLEQWRDIVSIGQNLDEDSHATRARILPDILARLARKGWTLKQILTLVPGEVSFTEFGDYSRFLADLSETQADIIAQFCRSFGGKKVEGRLWWEHSGTGAYPGDWDRTCKELAETNYNGIIANMLWGGSAHYKSDFLPGHRCYLEYGDQVAQAAAACKKYGLELHIWKVNFNMLASPKEFVDQMRKEGRTQVSLSGEEDDWLCPSHPENQKLEINVMLEVATKYPVAGIHFDYIRYNGSNYCFCDGCKERFGKFYFEQTGKKIVNLVEQYKKDDNIRTMFAQWKADQITAIVRGVRQRVDRECPQVKISAAVFRDYPDCRDTYGQDWVKWTHAGYLDFICPMDYTTDLNVFDHWVRTQLKLIDGRIPLYPGIGLHSSSSRQRADQTAVQIDMTRKLGAQGYAIFSLNKTTLNEVKDLLKQGPNQNRATMPHNKK